MTGVGRRAALDHCLKVFVYLAEYLADGLRMKHALPEARAARKPVREVAAHLLELTRKRPLMHFIAQQFKVAMQHLLLFRERRLVRTLAPHKLRGLSEYPGIS